MPNWVYNNLTITKKVWNNIKGKDEDGNENTFSFNNIIPKPSILNEMTAGGGEPEAVVYYKTNRLADGRTPEEVYFELYDVLKKMNMFYNQSTVERAFERLSEVDENGHIYWNNTPDELYEAGKKYWDCYEQYGHCDWYSWSIENWGTKWDACDVDVEEDEDEVRIFFTTAWDYPQPIFDKLIQMFPECPMSGRCEEEGHNFPTFEWEYTPENGLESWDAPDEDDDYDEEEDEEGE